MVEFCLTTVRRQITQCNRCIALEIYFILILTNTQNHASEFCCLTRSSLLGLDLCLIRISDVVIFLEQQHRPTVCFTHFHCMSWHRQHHRRIVESISVDPSLVSNCRKSSKSSTKLTTKKTVLKKCSPRVIFDNLEQVPNQFTNSIPINFECCTLDHSLANHKS